MPSILKYPLRCTGAAAATGPVARRGGVPGSTSGRSTSFASAGCRAAAVSSTASSSRCARQTGCGCIAPAGGGNAGGGGGGGGGGSQPQAPAQGGYPPRESRAGCSTSLCASRLRGSPERGVVGSYSVPQPRRATGCAARDSSILDALGMTALLATSCPGRAPARCLTLHRAVPPPLPPSTVPPGALFAACQVQSTGAWLTDGVYGREIRRAGAGTGRGSAEGIQGSPAVLGSGARGAEHRRGVC